MAGVVVKFVLNKANTQDATQRAWAAALGVDFEFKKITFWDFGDWDFGELGGFDEFDGFEDLFFKRSGDLKNRPHLRRKHKKSPLGALKPLVV